MTTDELVQMVKDAHDAAVGESMNCPWCGGWIHGRDEQHDDTCPWLTVKALLEEASCA